MTEADELVGAELRSCVTATGELELSTVTATMPAPGFDEVVIEVQAAPVNPSDLGLLLAGADATTLTRRGEGAEAVVRGPLSPGARAAAGARVGQRLKVGNEGAGVVVRAGEGAQALLGRTVAMLGGGMYARYRVADAAQVLVLPEGASARDGASCFINPLTALGMVETMRLEGHKALVHTAAASNLGQMLNKLCLRDGVGLVNVVRRVDQAQALKAQGARHVVVSASPDFAAELVQAISETGATLAFDATGGGPLAGQILGAMERALNQAPAAYSRYGSTTHKQVYIYGSLEPGPTTINRNFGTAWGLGGWLLTPFLARIGDEAAAGLKGRVLAELTTTFASHYTREISLRDVLDPEILSAFMRKATGEKYLINPSRP